MKLGGRPAATFLLTVLNTLEGEVDRSKGGSGAQVTGTGLLGGLGACCACWDQCSEAAHPLALAAHPDASPSSVISR